MANKKIIYGIGAIGVVATISTAIAIPLTLKKKMGQWVTENGSKVKSLPSGPYYIKNGTTLEDNEFVTDQTKGLGYKKEVKPKIINLSNHKFKDVKKIKIDEIIYDQKEISQKFEISGDKTPKYKITYDDGTIKYFTSEILAFSDAYLEETNGVGFTNGDIYSKEKPEISDPSFQEVTNGFVNSSGDKWKEKQPMKNDPSYDEVTNGFVNLSGDKWKEKQPMKNDPSYDEVTNGFVNSSGDKWKEQQPTKPDSSWKKGTGRNRKGYYAHLETDKYKRTGQVWVNEPNEYRIKDDSYMQIKNNPEDFTKVDGINLYASLDPSTGEFSIQNSIDDIKINISQEIKDDDFLNSIINKWIKKDATEVNIDDLKDAQPNKINPKYKNIKVAYTKDWNKYFEKQPKVLDNSWSPVDSGFKNNNGDYSEEQPKASDTSWSPANSGFKNDDGDYFTNQPKINDASWSTVDSGFKNDDGDYFEEQPKVLDNSYYENAEEGSYFHKVNKKYYANKNEAMAQSGIIKVSDPSWTGEKVIIDGEEITPISITAKWWYNAKDQKAPEKLYLVNNEFSFTQNIKKAKGYVEGNLPTAQTISSKNKIIIIDGIKYKWVSD